MGIRTWGLAVTTLAMSLGGGASADTGSFGDWAVVCDNVRNCTAMGFGELGETGSSALIKVSREAVPDAEPVISLITAGTRAAALRLVVDGTAPQGLSTVAATPIQDEPADLGSEPGPAVGPGQWTNPVPHGGAEPGRRHLPGRIERGPALHG